MRSRRRNAPSVPASLQRSASASNRRFSLPENWRRLAMATTSGSRRAASSEAISKVAIRATSETASRDDPFVEDFSNEVMFGSYLYSKLPETGVSPHIGTGGGGETLIAPGYGYESSNARHDHTNFPVASEFYMTFLGPLTFIRPDGSPIAVIGWEDAQNAW